MMEYQNLIDNLTCRRCIITRISNKLSNLDFIQLQKILMESYKPKPFILFLLKYFVNILYSIVFFLGFYYILKTYANYNNILLPALAAVALLIVLLLKHPAIYRNRLNKAIEKYYGRQEMSIERDVILSDVGLTLEDQKTGVKEYSWADFDRVVRDAKNVYLKFKNQDEGMIIKTEFLTPEDHAEVFSYLEHLNQTMEVR